MKKWIVFVGCMMGIFGAIALILPIPGVAAPWLAPAADEHISAQWVKDVARALESNRFKNVFMHQAFGCDQCAILGFLNDAADALESDNPRLAKSLVRRALPVLDDGRELGRYSKHDIRPIKRLIIRKANEGFKEFGAEQFARSMQHESRDPRYEEGDDPLFGQSDKADHYEKEPDRWTGYTGESRYGLTERLDQR
ncbi:MAG: hypothetical protein A4E19_20020 [Nitrospira sp. SG-bin1]|nr:MAG: hypothetical protein A4E19_20020 [Nitrospira sp. SG-bin1]